MHLLFHFSVGHLRAAVLCRITVEIMVVRDGEGASNVDLWLCGGYKIDICSSILSRLTIYMVFFDRNYL